MSSVFDMKDAIRACNLCKMDKPLSDFQTDKTGTFGKKSRCRDCCNKIQRERDYPKNKRSGLKNRPDRVKRLYGVTYDHVESVLKSQHGLCANRACGTEISLDVPISRGRAVIDHCHDTGKFRALLCTHCNTLLGKMENNQNRLLGLVEYLDKHK